SGTRRTSGSASATAAPWTWPAARSSAGENGRRLAPAPGPSVHGPEGRSAGLPLPVNHPQEARARHPPSPATNTTARHPRPHQLARSRSATRKSAEHTLEPARSQTRQAPSNLPHPARRPQETSAQASTLSSAHGPGRPVHRTQDRLSLRPAGHREESTGPLASHGTAPVGSPLRRCLLPASSPRKNEPRQGPAQQPAHSRPPGEGERGAPITDKSAQPFPAQMPGPSLYR